MKLMQRLFALLFPEKCVLCGRILEKEQLDLCATCRVDAQEYGASHEKLRFVDSWTALWRYEGNVRRSILRYKFYGRRKYASAYARLLGMTLMRRQRHEFDLITWVPISEKRRRKRGYDQCQLLAENLSRELQLPVMPLLKKTRDNPPQSGLKGYAQRKANVLGVYTAIDLQALSDKKILLLDDILTTGATAGECARVLLTAGAKEVHLAVIAAANQEKTRR